MFRLHNYTKLDHKKAPQKQTCNFLFSDRNWIHSFAFFFFAADQQRSILWLFTEQNWHVVRSLLEYITASWTGHKTRVEDFANRFKKLEKTRPPSISTTDCESQIGTDIPDSADLHDDSETGKAASQPAIELALWEFQRRKLHSDFYLVHTSLPTCWCSCQSLERMASIPSNPLKSLFLSKIFLYRHWGTVCELCIHHSTDDTWISPWKNLLFWDKWLQYEPCKSSMHTCRRFTRSFMMTS